MLHRPITILDEPTENLNPENTKKVWNLSAEVFSHRTLICLTHDLSTLHLFDEIITIQNHTITKDYSHT